MNLVLNDWIKKRIPLNTSSSSRQRLQPEFPVFRSINPSTIVFGLENIDACFMNQNEIYFGRSPIPFGNVAIEQALFVTGKPL